MVNSYKPDHPWKLSTALVEISRLQTAPPYRSKRNAYFVEGVRNFIQAIDHHHHLIAVFYSNKLLVNPLARKLVRQQRRKGVPTIQATPEQFRSISKGPKASGIGAIIQQRWFPLSKVDPHTGKFWIILDRVRSTGNFGTLIRTSEAAGGSGFILLNPNTDPYHPGTVRASMSAIFRQVFVRTTLQDLIRWRNETQTQIIGTSPNGNENFHHFDFKSGSFIFLGEERSGLSQQQLEFCDRLVYIPMSGSADSLNLGVAGSLIMYEIVRSQQRSS